MAIPTTTRGALPVAAMVAVFWPGTAARSAESPIRFAYHPIDFTLESCETPDRHVPETIAGGVSVFDFDNNGDLDIFFANGADIKTLKKTGTKYSNRLFSSDGDANFTDVTNEAGLAGQGFDNGVAIGDFDNDGWKDLFVSCGHVQALHAAP